MTLDTSNSIALAIVICGPVSGPHLNPCFTIAFALFKGFPWRKVPQYIISQIFGGFIAGLLVYVNYKQPLDTITDALKAAGLEAQIFTPQGVRDIVLSKIRFTCLRRLSPPQPAFPLALFKGVNQSIGYVFVNEFVGAFVIAVLVFSVLDPSNGKSQEFFAGLSPMAQLLRCRCLLQSSRAPLPHPYSLDQPTSSSSPLSQSNPPR